MIEINLLKKRQEKFNQKVFLIRIVSIYIIGFLCLLVILGISYLSDRIAIKTTLLSIENYKQKIKNESDIVRTLEKYKDEMDKVSKLLFLAHEEYRKRIIWSKRFNAIVVSVPENMLLSKMFLSEYTQGEKTRRIFTIEGIVMHVASNAMKLITEFMNNIRNNTSSEFSTISLVEIRKSDKIAKQQGTIFRIECGLKGE